LREKVAIGGLRPPSFLQDADALHRLCEARAG
jgi:hypothetical protein